MKEIRWNVISLNKDKVEIGVKGLNRPQKKDLTQNYFKKRKKVEEFIEEKFGHSLGEHCISWDKQDKILTLYQD